MDKNNYLGIVALQLGLSQLRNAAGEAYYDDSVDGKAGPMTKAAIYDLAKDLGLIPEETVPAPAPAELPSNAVLVFSLSSDGEKHVSEHFRVREFACKDGTDTVFIHPQLPIWAEAAREINGPFSPNSAYRTPGHNADVGGAALSKHCWGTAMDIPAQDATPEQLYAHFEQILGQSGGLGLYPWGIHVDTREVKTRWRE